MADQELDAFLGVKPHPTWYRYAKWGAAAVAALLLVWIVSSFFGGSDEVEYVTEKVERGRLVTKVSATGKLAPTNQVTVGSQLSGLVTKVLVDVNDRVTVGQPLAEIDPEQIEDQIRRDQAQLAANKAQVEQARATLAESRAQLARLEEVQRLSNGRVPSKTEMQTGRANLERAEASLKVAQANVLAAEASLAQNRTQRARAIIRSPVSGVVLARQVDPGQTVAATFNTPTLFVIAEDLRAMKLEVAIDEADVGAVEKGQKATFTVDAFPGRTFPAAITRVEIGSNLSAESASSSSTSTALSTGQVVSYAADLSVANSNLILRPGMTATADIVTSDQKSVLLVPNTALRFTPPAEGEDAEKSESALPFGPPLAGKDTHNATLEYGTMHTVYVKGKDGRPKPVRIKAGNTDGGRTAVLSGDLKEGMEVITGQLSDDDEKDGGGG